VSAGEILAAIGGVVGGVAVLYVLYAFVQRAKRFSLLRVGGLELWTKGAEAAEKEKRSYQDKLEEASSDNVFKYVYLINNASVEKYVNQSRGQAEVSFALSRRVAIAGFTLLVLSIGIGLGSEVTHHSVSIAYLSGIGGVLTEFIAGVFFWIYNRTLQQINLFYQGMMKQQQDALAAIGRESQSEREAEGRRIVPREAIEEADTPRSG
jgi:hypothetical protein